MLSTSKSDMPIQVMMSKPGQVMIPKPGHDSKSIDLISQAGFTFALEGEYGTDESTAMHGSGLPSGSVSESDSLEFTTSTKVDATLTDLMDEVLPSVGSAAHFQDQCVPCTLFAKNTCRFEQGCTFCHFEHVIKARPNKRARGRAKAYAARTTLSAEKSGENA